MENGFHSCDNIEAPFNTEKGLLSVKVRNEI